MAKLKYTSYTILSTAILAASCSNDDMSGNHRDAEGRKIEFRASLPEVATRATEVNAASLDSFRVSAINLGGTSISPHFLDKNFSKSPSGKYFSKDPECIWPNNNDEIRFVALAPSCEEMRKSGGFGNDSFVLPSLTTGDVMDSYDYKLSGFRVAHDIDQQIDFVTAIASGRLLDAEETGVNLNFQHQLSRIELNAWGASSSYDLEIAGVRLGGVGAEGDFAFIPDPESNYASKAGSWATVRKGSVEYIFSDGDRIVVLDKEETSPRTADKAVSILGSKIGGADGYSNSAMLIPCANTAWDYTNNPSNGPDAAEGMYFSVLLRVTDTTPYDYGNIVYPYKDNSEGMEVIYLAVDKETERSVKARLFAHEGKYFTDEAHTSEYDLEGNSAEARAFGWAALPVGDEWKPGYIYTYTLNYTNGVGLRMPTDPKPGTPVISDRVLVNVEMEPWVRTDPKDVNVPRR